MVTRLYGLIVEETYLREPHLRIIILWFLHESSLKRSTLTVKPQGLKMENVFSQAKQNLEVRSLSDCYCFFVKTCA